VTSPEEAVLPGLVVVDKAPGPTSHDVVAGLRRLAGTRRVGHAGTLDPMATGVLLAGVGRATRLLGHLSLTEKAYDATIRLGVATDTDDAQGRIVAQASADGLGEERVREVLAGFVGSSEQVPSSVSAVKVDGRRAYARVRDGETVILAPRPVTIFSLEVSGLRRAAGVVDVDVHIRCSSGTYIRALARDAGACLGVGGHLTALRRTSVGPFTLAEARTLDQLAESFQVVSVAEVAARCFPSHVVDDQRARDVAHGRPLEVDLAVPGPVAVFDAGGAFLALYRSRSAEGSEALAVPVLVFSG
jgi:tRNA pseudouridine55 synthase